ncbi:MAG TPA: calcium-binding protein, partial [Rhodobacterales bacterium]|nr:calcium-binding protein [Rhodobacterales bacterium]
EGNALLGEGNDIYRGRFGAVDGTVEGGNGDDVLNGGLRADSLDGGGGADLLRGRAGDDTLVGGFEDDRLFGGRGDDVIIPGEGVDMMKGGRDNDTFVFESFTDITPTGPTDHILDFRKGADLIDLSQMTPGTFAFSAKGFKGGGRESVTLAVRHGDTLVKIDFDGDGRLDGRFIVDDVKGLSAHDFIL